MSAWRGLVSACCERLAERLLRYALPEDAHWSSTKPVQVNTAVCVVRNEVWAYACVSIVLIIIIIIIGIRIGTVKKKSRKVVLPLRDYGTANWLADLQ